MPNRASSAASLEATALCSLEHEVNDSAAVKCERLPAVVNLIGTSL